MRMRETPEEHQRFRECIAANQVDLRNYKAQRAEPVRVESDRPPALAPVAELTLPECRDPKDMQFARVSRPRRLGSNSAPPAWVREQRAPLAGEHRKQWQERNRVEQLRQEELEAQDRQAEERALASAQQEYESCLAQRQELMACNAR
jgi:hypothetical protein